MPYYIPDGNEPEDEPERTPKMSMMSCISHGYKLAKEREEQAKAEDTAAEQPEAGTDMPDAGQGRTGNASDGDGDDGENG